MNTFFGPSFFTNNRAKLRQAVGTDVTIVITGNGTMQHGGDEAYKFHQDSSFWYLTGLNGSDLTLVMTAAETYLIIPTLSFEREAFDGVHDLAAYAARSGIDSMLNVSDGWHKLRDQLQSERTVATLASLPSFMKRHGLYTLPYRRQLIAKLKRLHPHIATQDIRAELAELRCIKQAPELEALQATIDITSATLQEIMAPESFQRIRHEYELEAALSSGFRVRGAEGHGFSPVVGAGKHATTLHHLENEGPIKPTDLIVIDVGASVEHYCADVARTVSQKPISGRKAEVFHAVAAVQDYALSLIKPGIQPLDYEKDVETYMGEQLRKLGVTKNTKRETIRHYFPHATSHFLGLDPHDAGDYRAPWQENMVIACEPGIYIPEEGIGVRIEDDILITKTGNRVLSSACPRELSPVQ